MGRIKHVFVFNPLCFIVSNAADEDNLFPYNFPNRCYAIPIKSRIGFNEWVMKI